MKGISSERIAKSILEKLGYRILETNKMVVLDDAKAFEVDIIAVDPEGEKYCVEVKAGKAGVSDVRQVFADSKILGLKPMLICKGFADKAAGAVSRELNVKTIKLSEHYILLEPEELEVIIRSAVRDVLEEYGFHPFPSLEEISEEDWRVIKEISEANSFREAAQHLQLSVDKLGKKISDLRRKSIFPKRGQTFKDLKHYSRQLIQRYSIISRLEKIESQLKNMVKILSHHLVKSKDEQKILHNEE